MLLEKNVFDRLDAPFAKKKEDIFNGDTVKITGDAVQRPDHFDPNKKQTLIKISTRNGERYMALNQDSINILIEAFGTNETKAWIGRTAKILLNPTVIGGKKVIVGYVVGTNWELDEYGSPYNPGVQPAQEESIPTINVDEEEKDDEIRLEDVPF